MLDELTTSSNLLYAALERYQNACATIQKSYARGEMPHVTTPQLSLRMGTEIELATSLELKLRQAKAAISWSRNRSHNHVTINHLPSEILVRIFRIVCRTQPCLKRDIYHSSKKAEPMYPAVLALVCSHWREVALAAPILWSHIDIATTMLLNRQRLDGLAGLHLHRVGQLPLALHVFDAPGYEMPYMYHEPIRGLVTQLASRLTSFDLDISDAFTFGIHNGVLSTLFEECTPGKLSRLTLTHQGEEYLFIRDPGHDDVDEGDEEDEENSLDLGIPIERLEDILSKISVLRVNSIFLPWNSRAYHGLVELRLTGWGGHITESELVNILRSSPDLCIFEFSLIIDNPLPANSPISPIPLNSLEVFNLMDMEGHQLATLLRWLAPGPKSLQLGVRFGSEIQLTAETRIFFSRYRVTRVLGKHLTFAQVLEILDMSPSLHEICIHRAKVNHTGQGGLATLVTEYQLERVYMTFCEIDMDTIIALVNSPALAIKTVLFYRCTLWFGEVPVPDSQIASCIEGMRQRNPDIKFILEDPEEPAGVESWSLIPAYQTPLA